MTIDRRIFLAGLAPLALAACHQGAATSLDPAAYPQKDITFIIPEGAGGGVDINARFLAAAMAKALPHRVHIVPINVASGGGGKGIAQLYRAPPDGYTIGIINLGGIFALQRVRHMPYDFTKFAWFGTVSKGDNYAIGVSTRSPIKTYADLVALSKTRPVTFTATGPDGSGYVATTIGTQLLGLNARMVTGYKSSTDYLVGAMRGDADAVIGAITNLKHMKGQLRIIASFEKHSSVPGIPDATTLGQPELTDVMALRALTAPPGTPQHILDLLEAALAVASKDKKFVTWAKRNDEPIQLRSADETVEAVMRRKALVDRWYR